MNAVVGIGGGFVGLMYDTICDRCGHCCHTLALLRHSCLHCNKGTMRIRTDSDIHPERK